MLSGSEKDQLLEGLRLHLRFEMYQQLRSQFSCEMEVFKEKFKADQINSIKQSFQNDFSAILEQARTSMQTNFDLQL